MVDTLDFSRYGVAIEQLKFAFRASYSLLDKVAFFINDYWTLGHDRRSVYFHSVWYKNTKDKSDGLHPKLENLANNCLRGLFWLSKDFVDKGESDKPLLGKVMEPDATRLAELRNHLEHKYVKVHDELAFHISTDELTGKSLKLLKLIRASLVYLSLAVHREEQIKASNNSNFKMTITMSPIK